MLNGTQINTEIIKQVAGSKNCYSVAAAMALKLSVKEVEEELLPAIAPYSTSQISSLMIKHGLYLGAFFTVPGGIITDEKVKYTIDVDLKELEAFIIVESETQNTGQTHAIYWDGEKTYDPNPLVDYNRSLLSYKISQIIPICKL